MWMVETPPAGQEMLALERGDEEEEERGKKRGCKVRRDDAVKANKDETKEQQQKDGACVFQS